MPDEKPPVEATKAPPEPKADDTSANKSAEAGQTKPEADGSKPAPDKDGSAKDSTDPKATSVVPEKYDLKLSKDSFLDAKDLDGIAAVARERGLSQEDAQAFVVNHEKEVAERIDRQAEVWLQEAKNDKEIGGQAFDENLMLATRLVEKFGSPRLIEEMKRTGYGNHPEWVRLFAKIGKHFANDKAVFPSSTPGPADKSLEEKLYPTMFPKDA